MAFVGQPVSVSIQTLNSLSVSTRFGRTLLLDRVSTEVSDKATATLIRGVREYSDNKALQDSDESDALKAAGRDVFFKAKTFPGTLVVGTQVSAQQKQLIFGVEVKVGAAESGGDNQAITLGSHAFTVDLDTEDTVEKIAGALQTAINGVAGIAGVTVSAQSDGTLLVSIPNDVDIGSGFAEGALAKNLGLFGDGVVVLGGISASESADTALNRLNEQNGEWDIVTFLAEGGYEDIAGGETMSQRLETVRNWSVTNNRVFIFESNEPSVLLEADSTSSIARGRAAEQPRVSGWYSGPTRQNMALAVAAIASGIRYNADPVHIALQHLPGIEPVVLTNDQVRILNQKRCNYYRKVGTRMHTYPGVVFSGPSDDNSGFLHSELLRLYLVSKTTLAVYNQLLDRKTVNQNRGGYQVLTDAIKEELDIVVASGFIGPGTVNESVLERMVSVGAVGENFNGRLSAGYLVHVAADNTISDQQRLAGEMPDIHFFYTEVGRVIRARGMGLFSS